MLCNSVPLRSALQQFCIHFPLSLQNSMKRISCSYLTRAITFCHTSGKTKEKSFMSLLSSESTRHAMYVQRNTRVHLRNIGCCGKAVLHIPLCVRACSRVALLIHHVTYRHIDIRGHWLHSIFQHYLINGTIFGKTLLNIKCVFWFSVQLLF
jgi:hypothetical protein